MSICVSFHFVQDVLVCVFVLVKPAEWDGFDVLVACVLRGKTERKKEEQVRAK